MVDRQKLGQCLLCSNLGKVELFIDEAVSEAKYSKPIDPCGSGVGHLFTPLHGPYTKRDRSGLRLQEFTYYTLVCTRCGEEIEIKISLEVE